MHIAGTDVVATGRKLVQEFKDDDLPGLAAELAYRFFLAIFPFLIFLAVLGGLAANAADVKNPAEQFLDVFGDRLPEDASSIIRGQVEGVVRSPNIGLLSLSFVGAIWAASGGVGTLIKAINRAYDIPESRPFWKTSALAMLLTVSAGGAIIAGFVIMVLAQAWSGRIAEEAGAGSAMEAFISLARWPVALVLVVTAITVVYWAAPNIGQPFPWVTPGAVLFAVGWLVMTFLFALYVANFSSYNATYGALGGVVVLLLWFYLTSLVMLLGAELNAVLDEQRKGPALAERRKLVAAELERRRLKKVKDRGTVAARGGEGRALDEALLPPQAAARRTNGAVAQAASPVMAIAGVALAALAWRRLAR